MHKLSLLLCLVFLLSQSCGKKDSSMTSEGPKEVPTCEKCEFTCFDENESDVFSNDCLEGWTCKYRFVENAKFNIDEFECLSSGEYLGFSMRLTSEGGPAIDDEISNILAFELDPSQESFSIEDSEFESLNVHFRRPCFCSEGVLFEPLANGCLQGEKQEDGNWFVQGQLELSYSWGDFELRFNAQFAKE